MTRSPVVIVVRERDVFTSLLETSGCRVLNLPTIKTVPLAGLGNLHDVLERIHDYDGIFFTSSAAAEVFVDAWGMAPRDFGGKIYVLGKKARLILERFGFQVSNSDESDTAAELVGSIAAEELEQKRMLFVRGDLSMRTIPEFLDGRAEVDEVVVYTTTHSPADGNAFKTVSCKLTEGAVDWICFFSPSGLAGFLRLFDPHVLENTKLAAIGTTTAAAIEAAGLRVDLVSDRATAESLAACLIAKIKEH